MLSIIYNQIGEKKMSDSFAQDLQAARKSGDRYLIAWVLCDQALACLSSNKLDEANAYIRECEALYDELGNKPGHFYVAKSQIAFAGEDHELAKTILAESIEKSKLIGEQNWQAIMLQNLGTLERDEENYEQAHKHAQEALKITEQMGDKSLLGGEYALLGQVEYLQGNTCGAKDNFIKSLTIAKELTYPGFQIGPLLAFSRTFFNLHPYVSARILSVWRTFIQNKNISMPRRIAEYYDHAIEQMRQCLNESAFNEAWEESEKISLDEALELALKTLNEM